MNARAVTLVYGLVNVVGFASILLAILQVNIVINIITQLEEKILALDARYRDSCQ